MRPIDADALAKFIDYGHLNNPNEKLYSENDIREMIDMMPTVDVKPTWIPCSERMPAKTGHCLCSFKKPNRIDNIFVDLAYWTGGRWYGYLANEINAWMPLPKPYEVKNDKPN